MELILGNYVRKYVRKIDSKWIDRWQFLSDFKEEIGDVPIPWTYTPIEAVDLWISLNRAMDKNSVTVLKWLTEATGTELNNMEEYERYRQKEQEDRAEVVRSESTDSAVIQQMLTSSPPSAEPVDYEWKISLRKQFRLSKLHSIISFMLPKSDRFLLFTVIDDELQQQKKLDYYRRLGEYIIKYGYSPNSDIFHDKGIMTRLNDIRLIFNVSEGVLDRLHNEDNVLAVRNIQSSIRATPLIRFFGILRNFYQYGNSVGVGRQWDEVRDLCMDPQSVNDYFEERTAVFEYNSTEEWMAMYIDDVRRVLRLLPDFSYRPLSFLLLTKSTIPLEIVLPTSNLTQLQIQTLIVPIGSEWYINPSSVSVEYARYIVECIDVQVDTCYPAQLGWFAGIVLGLEHVIIPSRIGSLHIHHTALPCIFALIYARLDGFGKKIHVRVTRQGDNLSEHYASICRILADTMGTFYLNACVKCLLRLVEHNESTGEEMRLATDMDDLYNNPNAVHQHHIHLPARVPYKKEKKSILLFIEAALEEIGDELTLFTRWPSYT